MNKEFERCCTFLTEMMEKYGLLGIQDILEELHYDPEPWGYDAEGHRLRYLAYMKNFQKSLLQTLYMKQL